MLNYVQLTITGTGLHKYVMKYSLQIRLKEKGKGWFTSQERKNI